MKISTVVSAVNDNSNYTRFIPIFIRLWRKLYPSINIKIIYIGEAIPEHLIQYSECLELFKPIRNISTAYTSQIIRILWPSIIEDSDGVIITDIDMLPANNTYFTGTVSGIDDAAFISMRPLHIVENGQIAICYAVARAAIWREIFDVRSMNDIISFITTHHDGNYDNVHGGAGWYSDQQILYNYVFAWKQRGGNLCALDDTASGFKRLDYFHHNYNKEQFTALLSTNHFSDCHMFSHNCKWTPEDLQSILEHF